MGGPVMIEGGGLGVYAPEEVGPLSMQAPNGVIDMLVADEAKAVFAAKQYLSYFQGITPKWTCADQRLLRHLIPENRLRAYNIRKVIETLAEEGSVLELRRQFGRGNSHETYQRGKALNIASLEIDDVSTHSKPIAGSCKDSVLYPNRIPKKASEDHLSIAGKRGSQKQKTSYF